MINTSLSINTKTYQRLMEIKEIFQKLFRRKNYSMNQKLDENVWFLKQDRTSLIEQDNTPDVTDSKMLTLLKELSDSQDPNKINVEVDVFIERIAGILVKSQEFVERSKKNIEDFKANENVAIIEAKINILQEMAKDGNQTESTLSISVGMVENFPKGKFNFTFNYTEFNPYDTTNKINKKKNLKDGKLLNLMQANDIIIVRNSEIENNFGVIDFSSFEIDNKSGIHEDDEYSGATLSQFFLTIDRNEEFFAISPTHYFFNLFLNSVGDLREIEKGGFSVPFQVTVEPDEKEGSNQEREYNVLLDLKFDLDPITRSSILRRIVSVFKKVIQTKIDNENIINEILKVYFPEISEKVKRILETKSNEEARDCDCTPCIII